MKYLAYTEIKFQKKDIFSKKKRISGFDLESILTLNVVRYSSTRDSIFFRDS